MSANAFRYSATGAPALAVTGQHFWDLYSFAASLRGAPGGQMGLVFGYRDENNYGLFRWSARANPLESAAGAAELVAVVDGREVVLQRALIGFIPEQWYRAEVTLGWGWAEVAVDGQRLLAAADPRLSGGAVGLWASSEAETLFDDVLVAESQSFQERFRGPTSTWSSWDFLNVFPKPADGTQAEGLELEEPSGRGGHAIFGSSRWTNCSIRAELLPRSGACGLLYHFRDAANYSCLSYDSQAGKLRLFSVRNGQEKDLAAPVDLRLGPAMHIFELRLDRGLVRASVDGGAELFAWQTDGETEGDSLIRSGRAGLTVRGGSVLARSVDVRLLAEIEPLPVVNPIFATDAEMGTWSSWHGDWASETSGSGDNAAAIRWHRARFSGDVQLLVEVAALPKNAQSGYELALSVAKSGDKPGNGYTFSLVRQAAAGAKGGAAAGPQAATLTLVREGQQVAEAPAPEGRIWTLALRKAGPFLIGTVNSREMIVWRDPAPLDGQKVAWKSRGVEVEEDGFRVYCPAVQNETFDRAPSDWRVAEGIWEVTNRWQCDPRWSFFSGRPAISEKKKLAALWNKRELGDDAVLEFFAGIKMDSARGGQYQYARDINCTLSADGRDLASGYSFLFGGFDDNRSSILRKGVEVAKTPAGGNSVIPRTGGIHHRWFYVRVERKGAELRFTVDGGKLVDLTFTDPDPLPGRRMAIWSWDCGIMISRVRASGPEDFRLEPLDFVPGAGLLAPVKDKAYELPN